MWRLWQHLHKTNKASAGEQRRIGSACSDLRHKRVQGMWAVLCRIWPDKAKREPWSVEVGFCWVESAVVAPRNNAATTDSSWAAPPLSPSNLTHGASHRVIFLKTPPTHRLDLDSATLHRPPWPVPCRSMPETPQSDALPALIGHHPCRFSHPRLLHRNAI